MKPLKCGESQLMQKYQFYAFTGSTLRFTENSSRLSVMPQSLSSTTTSHRYLRRLSPYKLLDPPQQTIPPPGLPFDYEKELFPILEEDDIYRGKLYLEYHDKYLPIYTAWNDSANELWNRTLHNAVKHSIMYKHPFNPKLNPFKRCHLLSKDCLKWTGINIRFELFDRLTGLIILQSRVGYFKYMWDLKQQVFNPEQYDLTQVQKIAGISCEADSNKLPLTVARLKNGEYCFEKDEIFCGKTDHCYPLEYHDFIFAKFCK